MKFNVDLQDLVNYALYYATQKDISVNVFYLCEILYKLNGSFVCKYGCHLVSEDFYTCPFGVIVPCLYVQYYCFNHGYMQMPKVHSVENIKLPKYIKEFLGREIPRILDLDRVELREKITSQGGAYHKVSCNDNILCGKISKGDIYEEFSCRQSR